MYHGSCLCGAVTYQIDGEIGDIVICHCQRCRKASGSAYAVNAPIKRHEFSVVSGKDALAQYSSSAGVYRVFCGQCSAPLYSQKDSDPEHFRLRLGTLDTPLTHRPVMHVFTASKAQWDVIYDDLPQFCDRP